MPLLPDGRVILIRQWRRPAGRELLEIPAGTREPGEDAETCARRELVEEIGYRAGRVERLAGFYTTPGFTDEYTYLYAAIGLEPLSARNTQTPEEHESQIERVALADVPRMIAAREIVDAKTIIGLTLVRDHLARRDEASS